jgi:L-aminopeptidase/D-esterase-like protein
VPAGPHNDLTDVAGLKVGHKHRKGRGWLTGTTVVLAPPGTMGSIDVRGGGPATRESDALAPTTLVQRVDAVCLSGGSAFGLAAADGVMGWLAARNVGISVGPAPEHVVPIVGAAALFDLGEGGVWDHRPDAGWGTAAAQAASARPIPLGTAGAGTGARTGLGAGTPLKGGIGSASVVLPNGVTVAALVCINPGGGVVDPDTGVLYGLPFGLPGEFAHLAPPKRADVRQPWGSAGDRRRAGGHTVLALVATDVRLTKPEANRLAMAGHDGMARAIRPIHGMGDGDVVFSLATGSVELPVDPYTLTGLMGAAADCVTRSVVHGVLAATGAPGLPAYLERYPSALRG